MKKKILPLLIVVLLALGSFATSGTYSVTKPANDCAASIVVEPEKDCGCNKSTTSEDEGSDTDYSTGLSSEDIAALQIQGEAEGWTFTVGENAATKYPLNQLCGLLEPEDGQDDDHFDNNLHTTSYGSLPEEFDWRDRGGLPSVKEQGQCGSCWAFAVVGALECNIKIKDKIDVDLSEQWLVSCNTYGYGCRGGNFNAHNFHCGTPDPCGDAGAVLEEDFPYKAADLACSCPYEHPYKIDSWTFIGDTDASGIPSVDAIKQAIINYGPITCGCYPNSAFSAYTGGILNKCSSGSLGHAVVLVGWSDNKDSDDPGYWILRNSWGTDWGENGYMRIKYGCCKIGRQACYIVYNSEMPIPRYIIEVEILKITNDPARGNFDSIDDFIDILREGKKPEWYYRVGVGEDGEQIYQYNYNRDPNSFWIFGWISQHTWKVEKIHQFEVNDYLVEVTIKLMENDVLNGDDLADISGVGGGGLYGSTSDEPDAIFNGIYSLETDELKIDGSDPFGIENVEEVDYYTIMGNGMNNAKVLFRIKDDYTIGDDIL